mmetsp:Transcript_17988/g.20131  ORF Transcript_17988/g.20131 Transcript_17988/m.20131 type:complete len:129 (-) Transcript_17988:222-608(-)
MPCSKPIQPWNEFDRWVAIRKKRLHILSGYLCEIFEPGDTNTKPSRGWIYGWDAQRIVSGHQWHHPTTAKGTDADDTAAQDPRIRQQVKELGFQHATASTRGTVPKGTTPSVIDRSSYQDRYGPTNCG